MKKFNILLSIVLLVVFTSCSWIELNPETSGVIASISSRRIGVRLQQAYPDIAQQVEVVCDAILKTDNETTEVAFSQLKETLVEISVRDILLQNDIKDLLSLIKISPDVEVTQAQKDLIQTIAIGLKTGILIGGSSDGE